MLVPCRIQLTYDLNRKVLLFRGEITRPFPSIPSVSEAKEEEEKDECLLFSAVGCGPIDRDGKTQSPRGNGGASVGGWETDTELENWISPFRGRTVSVWHLINW